MTTLGFVVASVALRWYLEGVQKNNDTEGITLVWGYASAVAYLLALVARVIGG